MRIKQISVTELFGIFNHVIPLNTEDRITIIYSLNGIGKTAILKLLNYIFSFQFLELANFPFKEIQIDFDDGSCLYFHVQAGSNIDVNTLRDKNCCQNKY
jgi:predicted ATP-binding protein involved in virulence